MLVTADARDYRKALIWTPTFPRIANPCMGADTFAMVLGTAMRSRVCERRACMHAPRTRSRMHEGSRCEAQNHQPSRPANGQPIRHKLSLLCHLEQHSCCQPFARRLAVFGAYYDLHDLQRRLHALCRDARA